MTDFVTDSDEYLSRLGILFPVKSPSWKIRGNGFADMRIQSHKKAGWLEISMREVCTDNKDKYVTRSTMICMDREDAIKLRDFLNDAVK